MHENSSPSRRRNAQADSTPEGFDQEMAAPDAPPGEGGPDDEPASTRSASFLSDQRVALAEIDWEALHHKVQETLDTRIPPERQRLGILDLARLTDLTVQQIRLLEHHGLVTPEFETSGEKRNRRYTREQAVLILLAAEMIHQLNFRPGKAAMLVLSRHLDRDLTRASGTQAATARHETRGRPSLATHDGARSTTAAATARMTPGLDLFDVADVKVRRVIAARLAATAVSSLLGERDLPARWVIHVRRAAQAPEADATALAPDAPDGTSQFVSFPVTHIAAPDPTRGSPDDGEDPFFAFVAREGEVFSFSPMRDLDGQEILNNRQWHAITLPADESHPAVDVLLGIPQHRDSGLGLPEAARRLLNDRLPVRRSVVDVAAALLWTVAEVIPEVIRTQSQLAREGDIDLEALARHGVTTLVLWLYACVLVKMCPGADQCDVLVPDGDPDGGRPVLRIIASTNLDEWRASTRAAIPGGQLLSGFAFSMAQPCYVEDVRGPYSVLLSFHRQEHARAAAAIPVTHEGRTHACVYLSSRHGRIPFTSSMRRTLEVAADEIAEVLRLHDVGWHVSAESILHALRPYRIDETDALQEVIGAWVEELAQARRTRAASDLWEDESDSPATDQDDRRLVMAVIRAEVDPRFREQPEIALWLEEVARQTADSLAEAVDAGDLDGHPPRPLFESDDELDDEQGRLPALTRVFRWRVRGSEAYGGSTAAYVVLAGDHHTHKQVQRLKDLMRQRGLDGSIPAQTEAGAEVGRILGWVMDEKRSVVQLALRARSGAGQQADREATRHAVQQIVRDVHSCVRILPLQHQFHRLAFREGNLERAIVTLKQALTLSPHDTYAVRHLLDLYVRTGRLDEAITLAQDNQERAETMPTKWFWSVGQAHLMRGEIDDAIAQFEQAIRRDPSHPSPYRLMAEAYLAQGQYHLAEEWLRRALDCEESRSERHVERIIATTLLLGDVLVQQGRLDAAISTYQELLVTHPKQAKDNVLVNQRLTAVRLQRRQADQGKPRAGHAR